VKEERKKMSWLEKHKRIWRTAIFILLILAVLGPWAYERISVPAEYACSPPYIRLEGDFCGFPWSWIRGFFWVSGGLISISVGMVTGELIFIEWIREIFVSLLLFLPLLPFFSTLLLILREDHPHRQVFTIIAWGLSIGMGLFWGLNNNLIFFGLHGESGSISGWQPAR
jgi:hypothetical protein